MNKKEVAKKMKFKGPKEEAYYGKCKACGHHHVPGGQHKMIEGHSKKSQKGKASLLRPKGERNEGEHLTIGKQGDEEPVA